MSRIKSVVARFAEVAREVHARSTDDWVQRFERTATGTVLATRRTP